MLTVFNGYETATSEKIISDNLLPYIEDDFIKAQASITASRIRDHHVYEYLCSVTEVIGVVVICGETHFIYKTY